MLKIDEHWSNGHAMKLILYTHETLKSVSRVRKSIETEMWLKFWSSIRKIERPDCFSSTGYEPRCTTLQKKRKRFTDFKNQKPVKLFVRHIMIKRSFDKLYFKANPARILKPDDLSASPERSAELLEGKTLLKFWMRFAKVQRAPKTSRFEASVALALCALL